MLDIATATGTVALVAARAGMHVVACDFSAEMVGHVAAYGIPTVEARQLDGRALDLPSASFDAAVSMFGISLFDDWRAGLSEMARVVRPGGVGSLGTWTAIGGAAGSLLLAQLCAELLPAVDEPASPDGQTTMRDPHAITAAMASVGFGDVRIVEESCDYLISADELADPDRLFVFNSQWKQLDDEQRSYILDTIASRYGDYLPIRVPSPAAIATAFRL